MWIGSLGFRWWNEARESLFTEINGVSYLTSPSGDFEDGGLNSEVVLGLRSEEKSNGDDGGVKDQGFSGREYALIAEWMFLRALKWHNDIKNTGSFMAGENNRELFSLQIRLSLLRGTNSLVVKISQKDNEVGAFKRACNIFYVESGLLRIWDFSGQTTQFFINDRKFNNDSDQPNEILMELQVYGLSSYAKQRLEKKDDMQTEQSKIRDFHYSGSLEMNGTTNNEHSYFRVARPPFASSFNETCELGLTGLHNLGNTCFMNSAIQCLVHTPKLNDYFLGDFRKDLNFENPLGMNGKLALAFGDLLRKLWAPGATPVAPKMFKSILSAFAPQFSGYNQHDSQEFLAFLLDGLHEDVNRVKCKPYIEVKDTDGYPDEEVADEHWQNHLARNDSIIVDMCQGQFRSTLVCPLCKKLSITFDPFMYLSLPLPSTTMRTMTLTLLSTDGTTLPIPVNVTVPKYGSLKDIVQAVSTSRSLGEDETLLVAEIFNNRFLRFLDKPSDSIELIRDNDQLVAYRFPKAIDESPLVVFMHQCEKLYFQESSWQRFGIPLVARMSDFSAGSEIRRKFIELLNPFLIPDEYSVDVSDDGQNAANQDTEMDDAISTVIFDGDTSSGIEGQPLEDNDFEFYLEERGRRGMSKILMNEPVPISGSDIINVVVSWPDKMLKLYDTSSLSLLPEICGYAPFTTRPQESVSLYKCLEAFLKEEPLGPEDMWYCPNCKKHQQATKKLDLWRLPEILVIHLKRFSYNRFLKDKLETFVDFPVDDFDLSSYIVQKDARVSNHYKLYAVSNHYGVMGGGHYTAFAQHGHDCWYEFDDSHVYPLREDQIKTPAAYVLFYRRISDV